MTTVPITRTRRRTATVSRGPAAPAAAVLPPRPAPAGRNRHHSRNVTAMIAIDSRKCRATSHGIEVGQHGDAAEHRLRRDAEGREQRQPRARGAGAIAPSQVASAISADDERQLPVGELDDPVDRVLLGRASASGSVHAGQVGQPRPESVSRTAPPVTTMTTLATTDASASRRSARGGLHPRGSQRTAPAPAGDPGAAAACSLPSEPPGRGGQRDAPPRPAGSAGRAAGSRRRAAAPRCSPSDSAADGRYCSTSATRVRVLRRAGSRCRRRTAAPARPGWPRPA